MLLSGDEYLESLRDGRVVYIGRERVDDVTGHPAFKNAAGSFAMIYDRKRAPEERELMVCEEDGDEFSSYFVMPRSRADLERRFEVHRRIASWTYGLLGRSPDNFPSYLAGLASRPELFDELHPGFGANLTAYYKRARRDDLFMTHTVTNPQGSRRPEAFEAAGMVTPTLCVVDEDDTGVTLNGLKMIGTSAIFCHEAWVGNLQPVAPGQEKESITCAVPLNAPGVSMWARKPYERDAISEFDMPLTWRFDETDAAVLFENVKVPWENVFLHDNVEMTRAIYTMTPGHSLANHQANVRFLEKLKLIVAVAHAITRSNKVDGIPAVQTVLGELAAKLATLEGMIMGQIQGAEEMVPGSGYVTMNRRYVYAALHWCTTNHAEICDILRDLMGGAQFQMPADSSVFADPELAEKFETYWSTPDQTAKSRMKLTRLAWDLVGSEFAGRHMQYEKFYAGPGFVMNLYSFLSCPWNELGEIVDGLMSSYDVEPPRT
jgi:4-hydroxyphenylacetate 3-monooxygenase